MDTISVSVLEYFDLVSKAASWKTVVNRARESNEVSSSLILALEEENEKDKRKDGEKFGKHIV